MNLFAEAAERSTVCGEDDACSSSYLCVSFLRPLPYISQPRSLCAGEVYCVDSSMNIRVNRVLIYWRGTYGSTLEGKAQLMVGDDDVDIQRTPYLRHSIVGSYSRTINDVAIDLNLRARKCLSSVTWHCGYTVIIL